MNDAKLQGSLFKRIGESQLFTNHFGSFNKGDYETLMFTVFLDCLDEEPNDYDISITLGIPESKVRSLRLKSQLRYPREIKWDEKLVSAIQHGTYDSVQKMITITIEDPSVRNMIRHEIESKFGTVNLSMNSKQLVLPVESFLIIAACAEKNPDEIIKRLNKELHKSKVGEIEKSKFKNRFFKSATNIVTLIGSLLSLYSGGAAIISAVLSLIQE